MQVRRQFLLALAASPFLWLPTTPALAGAPLTIFLPYPKGAFDAIIHSLEEPLSRHLGRDVLIEHVPGDGGWEAIERLRSGDPDSTILADAELTLALKQKVGGRGFEIDQLRPVAKLTDGISVALIATAGASHGTWPELAKAMSERPLTLAATGPHSAFGVAEALLVTVLGSGFTEVREPGPQAIFDAVSGGKAELGLITTNLIQSFNAAATGAKVAPIVTFGAKRSPQHPDTPTLAELSGNDKYDFTFALGFYGNKAMSPDVAERIYQALIAAQADPAIVEAPVHANFPLNVHDATVLQESFERDLRLLRRLGLQ
jgi:tripartite-type tricarboxylate transporter receptor subunit TctC